jgi:hypothetical protein
LSNPPPAIVKTEVADLSYCRNCGAPLTGAYCADCSQRADVHIPSTLELVHEALEGVTHSDSRLWTTMRYLLFVPGKLTLEFIAGRRIAYLPPFRLYLVMSVLFFLIASILPGEAVRLMGLDDAPKTAAGVAPVARTPEQRCTDVHSDIFEAQIKHACERIIRDNGEAFKHDVVAVAPKAMFILLPLIAFFHMLLYWFPRHRYAVHLLFFVHVHAFAFLAMSIAWLLNRLGHVSHTLDTICGALLAAVMVYMPVYLVLAMKRVFRRGGANTLFKAVILLFIYLIVLSFTMAGTVLYAALRL